MALDLFFLPRKLSLDEARSQDFTPTPAMLRARRKLIAKLLEDYPGSSIEGDPMQAHVANFPRGEMTLTPGYIAWTLHGASDESPIHEIVAWFHDQDMVCEDPQDAGFGNRDLKRGASRRQLNSFEDLVGGQFSGIRLLREWVAGLLTEWNLADGSYALIQFVHFRNFRLPDIGALVAAKVIGVHFESREFDTLKVYFENDLELVLEGAVFQKWSVQAKRPA